MIATKAEFDQVIQSVQQNSSHFAQSNFSAFCGPRMKIIFQQPSLLLDNETDLNVITVYFAVQDIQQRVKRKQFRN